MDIKLFYICVLVIAYLIQSCCSQKQQQPYIEIIEANLNGKSIEEVVNNAIDDIAKNIFNKDAKSLSTNPNPTTTVVKETLDNKDDDEEIKAAEEIVAKPTTVNSPIPTTAAPSVKTTTQVITRTTTVVISQPKTVQNSQTSTTRVITQAPTTVPQVNVNTSSSKSIQSSSKNLNTNSKIVTTTTNNQSSGSSNTNYSSSNSNISASSTNTSSNASAGTSNNAVVSNAIVSNPIPDNSDNNNIQIQAAEPEAQSLSSPDSNLSTSPDNNSSVGPIVNNSDNKLAGGLDGQNNTNKEAGKKSGILSLVVKISLGIAAGGICIAGLIVGKNKLSQKSDKDVLPNNNFSFENLPSNTFGSNAVMNLQQVDPTFVDPNDNYTQKLQPNNYLNNPNLPTDNIPNGDFINTDSIEPLPNLVNKVDVELPIYNIKEENYNTVGRQIEETEPINTWNEDEEINDETQLINTNEGYNHIVPEMGEMVIENNHRPSLYAALEELENEGESQDPLPNENMKQIIPDIQYATVEVNNEFDNIDIDDEELNQPGNDNMKQIIPDIQYATVEVNNEFAGIDEDESIDRNSRVVVDIDAQHNPHRDTVASVDADVQELRVSQDFLAMPSNIANFKNISDTYRNALRDTFDSGNRDTLNSTDSILHKLR
ncbi:hypothetical protein BCR36DRAFT_585316 [Piromyces finnis]|uniref:Mid2 domain-containing protein n=1 Tax=Piromyces finnis TaxID=1754191 RepID=A0A1Y1V3A8_9FUNG|nr:hypothetical protein BCR36DRAFT_585316 [Piromyces finnis]|eukprot:ORX46173.1 hypothetical protein BCR36DRAFT_585316 [Piromyces finnis]